MEHNGFQPYVITLPLPDSSLSFLTAEYKARQDKKNKCKNNPQEKKKILTRHYKIIFLFLTTG